MTAQRMYQIEEKVEDPGCHQGDQWRDYRPVRGIKEGEKQVEKCACRSFSVNWCLTEWGEKGKETSRAMLL